MKTTPRNKMINTSDEITKGQGTGKLGVQVSSWYFTVEKKTIVAETYEEALNIINKEKSK